MTGARAKNNKSMWGIIKKRDSKPKSLLSLYLVHFIFL
jgi:hypothetical protein